MAYAFFGDHPNSDIFDLARQFRNIGFSHFPSTSEELKARVKPKLVIPFCYRDLSNARCAWRTSLVNGDPDPIAAKEFIYYKLQGYTEVNTVKWKSYGIVIAQEGEKINPFCMFNVTIEHFEPKTSGLDTSSQFDKTLLLYALGIYHMLVDCHYKRRKIMNKVYHEHINSSFKAPSLLELVNDYGNAQFGENFGKLVVGLDMFLQRFPKNQLFSLRVGTIWTRYKDCEALSAVLLFMKMVGTKDIKAVTFWLVQNPLLYNFERIMTPGEEPGEESSYMPYMAVLNFVSNIVVNPYSAAANPCLYQFIHQVAALMGIQESIDTVMPDNVGHTMDFNVKLVAHAFNNFQKEIKARVEGQGPPANPEMVRAFQHILMLVHKKSTVKDMPEILDKLRMLIVDPKKNTIGYYVKNKMN